MRSRPLGVAVVALLLAVPCHASQVTVFIPSFNATTAGEELLGKKVATILNLQVWQTLRLPPSRPKGMLGGGVLWDFESKAPDTLDRAIALAREAEEDPQLVLWGRTWRYGNGYVVEAFLAIRRDVKRQRLGERIWTVRMDEATMFAVDVPEWQVEFAPFVLRSDLLPELLEPAGLKLYAAPRGDGTKGLVGDYFKALEQGPDSAKVILPDHREGWIRLPNLSKERSEVVSYCGGLVRALRQDWSGATELFGRVAGNDKAPVSVRIDALLLMALAGEKTDGDGLALLRRAYDLNPYSTATVQYLCMHYLAAIARYRRAHPIGGANGPDFEALRAIVQNAAPLFDTNASWLSKVKQWIESERRPAG